jgi:hypothetical protein
MELVRYASLTTLLIRQLRLFLSIIPLSIILLNPGSPLISTSINLKEVKISYQDNTKVLSGKRDKQAYKSP